MISKNADFFSVLCRRSRDHAQVGTYSTLLQWCYLTHIHSWALFNYWGYCGEGGQIGVNVADVALLAS